MSNSPRVSSGDSSRKIITKILWGGTFGALYTAISTLFFAVFRGGHAAISAAIGVLLVAVFFGVGVLAMRGIIAGTPGISLLGAFVVYGGQLLLLAAAYAGLSRAMWLDGSALAVAGALATIGWQTGAILSYRRTRPVLYPRSAHSGEVEYLHLDSEDPTETLAPGKKAPSSRSHDAG